MKKTLKTIWRILSVASMIAILFISFTTVVIRPRPSTWPCDYSDSYLIEHQNEKIRIVDAVTGKYITPKLDEVYFYSTIRDTLTVFRQNGRRGYLNVHTGKIVIPAQYDRAWIFSEGLGAVVKDKKVGFIDRKGKLVIPYQFIFREHWTERVDFLFKKGFCTVIDSTGKHGLIDKTGKWVISPQYDYINNPVGGYRIVKQDGKYGVMNELLQWHLPIAYDWLELRQDGFIVRQGSEQQLLALDGKTVLQPLVYDNIGDLTYRSDQVDNEGNHIYIKSNCLYFNIDNKYGLMDKNGKVITDAIYADVNAINSDLFACNISNYSSIIVNSKGEIVK